MATFNSQVLYGWTGSPDPLIVEQGEEKKKTIGYDDFMRSMDNAEKTFGEKIIQDNSESTRIATLISDNALTTLDTGTATTAQIAAQVNSMISIFTNFVNSGKNRN